MRMFIYTAAVLPRLCCPLRGAEFQNMCEGGIVFVGHDKLAVTVFDFPFHNPSAFIAAGAALARCIGHRVLRAFVDYPPSGTVRHLPDKGLGTAAFFIDNLLNIGKNNRRKIFRRRLHALHRPIQHKFHRGAIPPAYRVAAKIIRQRFHQKPRRPHRRFHGRHTGVLFGQTAAVPVDIHAVPALNGPVVCVSGIGAAHHRIRDIFLRHFVGYQLLGNHGNLAGKRPVQCQLYQISDILHHPASFRISLSSIHSCACRTSSTLTISQTSLPSSTRQDGDIPGSNRSRIVACCVPISASSVQASAPCTPIHWQRL
nr:MAG TPA: hypothetical protein [Caudoviricetes sp.]